MFATAVILAVIRCATAQCDATGQVCSSGGRSGELSSPSLLQRYSASQEYSPHQHDFAGSHRGVLMAGDTVYLRNAKTGRYLEAKKGRVTCTGNEPGEFSQFRIEKKIGGGIHQWDTVFFRTNEDKYLGVDGYEVSADWIPPSEDELDGLLKRDASLTQFPKGKGGNKGSKDRPFNPWDEFKDNPDDYMPGDLQLAFWLDKEFTAAFEDYHYQTDVIRVGDEIFLRAYTTHYVSVNKKLVSARGEEGMLEDEAKFTIVRQEKHPPSPPLAGTIPSGDVIKAGDQIFFRAHTGKHLAIPQYGDISSSVKAGFDNHGHRQKMILEKVDGGVIHAGDEVYIKDSNGFHLQAGGQYDGCTMRVPFGSSNQYLLESGTSWKDSKKMKFVIEKDADSNSGPIYENDTVYIKSMKGTYVFVFEDWCPRVGPKVLIGGTERRKGFFNDQLEELDASKGWGASYEFTIERGMPCTRAGSKFLPDLKKQKRTDEASIDGCQARCASVSACAHFSYWPDGGCHLAGLDSNPYDDPQATSGLPSCRDTDTSIPPTVAPTPSSGKGAASGKGGKAIKEPKAGKGFR